MGGIRVAGGANGVWVGRGLRLAATMFVVALLITAASGCAGGAQGAQGTQGAQAQPGAPKPGGKLVFGAWQDPDTLDPQKTGLAATARILMQVFDPLVTMQAGDSKIYPGAAESWEVSPDAKHYTLKLKKGIKFHDGTPLNAAAVKFTFDRVVDPKTRALSSKAALGPYESTDVVDEFTARVNFKDPYPAFLTLAANATLAPISPAAVQKLGDDFARQPVGTGPFKIKEFVPKSHVTLVRNPEYNWASPIFKRNGPAYLDEIVWKIIPEVSTRMATLDTGETAAVEYMVPQDVARYQKDSSFKVLLIDTPGAPRMNVLNVTRPPLDDVNVRRALLYATDRKGIVDTLFKGVYDVAYGPLEKATFGYDADVEKMYPYDPGKAKQLLEDAGWKAGAGGIRQKSGEPLKLLFIVQTNDQWDEVAQMWQAQLRDVGVDVQLQFESSPTVFATYNKGTQHVSEFFFWSPDPVFLYAMFHSKNIPSGFNWAHYSIPEVDQMIEASMREADPAKRIDILKRVQKRAMEDATIVPVLTKRTVIGHKATLQGLQFAFTTYPLFYNVHFTDQK